MAALVVCSRTAEYEAATERQRLALQGAVVVQPLTHSDVDTYLVQAGKPLTGLRRALKKNTALHTLSTTPLMLNILMLTYQGKLVRDLPNKEVALQKLVWNDYIERMVIRKGNSKRYPLGETRARLSYLARQMRDHNQTVFYLEHLQPSCLNTRQQRIYAGLAVRLPALIIGALVSILVTSFIYSSRFIYSPFIYSPIDLLFLLVLQSGVMGGLLAGVFQESVSKKEERQGHPHASLKRLGKRLAVSACIGLLFFDVTMVGGCLLLQYLLARPFHPHTFSENSKRGIWQRVVHLWSLVQGPRILLGAIVLGLISWLSEQLGEALSIPLSDWSRYGPRDWLYYWLARGLSSVLDVGLSFGLMYALISLALGTPMETIHLAERVRWTWRGLFTSRHLRMTILLTCIAFTFIELGDWLTYWLRDGLSYVLNDWLGRGLSGWLETALSSAPRGLGIGLSVGLAYWFVLGFIQGMTQERIEDQDRRRPNQGIHRSLRNSAMMGIIGGGIIAGAVILSHFLSLGLSGVNDEDDLLSFVLYFGLPVGIMGALLIGLLTGGLAVWRHSVIRFLLWRSRTFPMRAPQFLNDATARILLRRIGGGYSFVHRLLLDHLADAVEQSTKQASTSTATPSSPASS
jgi:hypothetical protein